MHSARSGAKSGAQETRQRILAAGQAEFAEHGFAGARVDRIAAAAGANKQLIYRYFSNKEGLYDAVIENLASQSRQTMASVRGLGASYLEQFGSDERSNFLRDAWARIIAWEGLTDASSSPSTEAARRENYRLIADWIADDQRRGVLPKDFEPQYLEALFTSASLLPFTMPKVFEMILGRHPDDNAVADWVMFLRDIVAGARRA